MQRIWPLLLFLISAQISFAQTSPNATAPAEKVESVPAPTASDLFLNKLRDQFKNKEISYGQFRKVIQARLNKEKNQATLIERDLEYLLNLHTETLLETKEEAKIQDAVNFLFSVMEEKKFFLINYELSFDKLKEYFEKHKLSQQYSELHKKLAFALNKSSDERTEMEGPLPLQIMEVRLLNYLTREEYIAEDMKRIVNHPKLFIKREEEVDYEGLVFSRIAALNMMGEYPQALEQLNQLNIPEDVANSIKFAKYCRHYLEKIDLLIKTGKGSSSKKLIAATEARALKHKNPEQVESCLLELYSTLTHYQIDTNEFKQAASSIAKMKKIETPYAKSLLGFVESRLKRVTGKANTEDYINIENESWSISTTNNLYSLRQNLITAIYLKEEKALSDNLAALKVLLSQRWENSRHENILGAWELIGKKHVLGQEISNEEIESKIAASEKILGKFYYPHLELRRFIKKNLK